VEEVSLSRGNNHNLQGRGDEEEKSRENIASSANFKKYYFSDEYEIYIVEYIGNVIESISKTNYASILSGLSNFGIIAVKKGMVNSLLVDVPEIINIEKNYGFALSDMEFPDSPYGSEVFDKDDVTLEGDGVIVGIIGTGIDYTNERFMTEDKKSRVVAIWDQTLDKGPEPANLMYGTEFNKEQIAEALKEKLLGRDPYAIVPHKDDKGYGTAIAGIIGARNLGNGDIMKSLAPKCEFAVVKLKKASERVLEQNYISNREIDIYEESDIGFGIRYLSELQGKLNKPMVVYLPLGNNCSGHDGSNGLERYIDFFTMKRGFIIVTNTGSQGEGRTHTSGELTKTGDIKTIDIEVDKAETKMCASIWITKPDKVAIGIIAPNGERVNKISAPRDDEEEVLINFSGIEVLVQFFIQQQTGGEQVIFVLAKGNVGGIWQINIIGEYVASGRFDSWMNQWQLLKSGTKFINTDPYITLTIPATSNNIIATTYYNQINNTHEPKAGNGFTRDNRIKPIVTVGAKNVLTVGLENKLIVTGGASMAGGILSGVIALLLQWGIVLKNDTNLYTTKVGIYLIRGTIRTEGIVYPNPQWGYGILNIEELFKSLNRRWSEKIMNSSAEDFIEIFNSNFEINIPVDLYKRFKMI